MDKTLDQFYKSCMEEIGVAQEENLSGWQNEDFLTELMLEYLEETGEAESPVICPFRSHGIQMNAYAVAEDYSDIQIFVTVFSESETPKSVSQTEIDAVIKRGIQLYQKAVNDLYESFQHDNDTYEFAKTIHDQKNEIKTVRICALTNGLVKPIPFRNLMLDGVEISFSVWDIDRLYRCVTSGKMRETIEIDFQEKFGQTIPCIESNCSAKYSVYLAIINGSMLAGLYDEYRDRLLEKNVRSFLQVKGGVNKGIRDTLKQEPEMFLAYNNGISVTAESVKLDRDENGKPSIRAVRDMQIVNGGQTTASIFSAMKNGIDLSDVHVQMKLSVISSPDDMDEIVPLISKFANTQNKVQVADFSANDPFHRKLEDLSRTVWTSGHGGMPPLNWYYERARGQYADRLQQETTPAKKKQFKATHPLFTKTDVAKYEMTWDQLPYYVSEGAQKCFNRFTVALNSHKVIPDEKFYHNLIAKAIMFRTAEKLVSEQKYGGYRANIVTYTLAWISWRSAQRINLEQIWKTQMLSDVLCDEIVRASRMVHAKITSPPGGANISEWCKKEKCWLALQETEDDISYELKNELIDVSKQAVHNEPKSSIYSTTEEEKKLIAQAMAIKGSTWFALSKWAKETGNFESWQRSIVFSVGKRVSNGQSISYKQAKQVMIVYEEAKRKGFTDN